MHFFMQRITAAKSSKNRKASIIVLQSVNVTKETYMQAFAATIIPQLQQAIQEKKLPNPLKKKLLLLQNDNTKPHRGPYLEQIDVSG
jgi:hypothetical protein